MKTQLPAAAPDPARPGARTRERRSLSGFEATILVLLGVLPLLSIAIRILTLPGVEAPAFAALIPIGDRLNQFLSLSDVPTEQRNHIIYLLLIPTSALLVTLARLTLGLKVFTFRSILISVAFHQSGLVASFVLIVLAIVAIQILRPWLKHIELPKYARMSMTLSIMAVLMIGALLLGPWMRTDIAWGMVAFPVIALGFLADGIARTADRDHFLRACWIGFNTIALALVMALIYWIPAVRGFVLRFPEIVLTEAIGVVVIAKYFDLRLLEHWDAGMMRNLRSRSLLGAGFRVAVIRNRVEPGLRSRRTLRSVQKIVDALRAARYRVKVMEGDASLPRELRKFFPEDPATGEREGVVLNLAHGGRGDAATTHVPAMLEVFGVAYTGPTPLGHAMAFDRVASRMLMHQAGIRTPKFLLVPTDRRELPDVTWPAVVSPRREPEAKPAIVSDRRHLRAALGRLRRRGVKDAFIEEHVAGRHISVGLLGNGSLECLPLVELDAKGGKVCPARLDEQTAERTRDQARAAFRACGCRDYGRVDIRIDEAGGLWVKEVRTLGILAARGAFVRAATEAGYSLPDLMRRIVEVTRARSRPRSERQRSSPRASRSLVQSNAVGSR